MTPSAKKRGRPTRDRLELAMSTINDFIETARDEKYFHSQINFRRALGTARDDFVASIGEKDGYPDDEEHRAIAKQLQIAQDLSRAWAKAGSFTEVVSLVFVQSVGFAKLSPPCTSPCPGWLKQLYISFAVEACRGFSCCGRFRLTFFGFCSRAQYSRIVSMVTS